MKKGVSGVWAGYSVTNLGHKVTYCFPSGRAPIYFHSLPGSSAGKGPAWHAGDALPTPVFLGLPGGSDDKKICLQCEKPGFSP